MNSFSGTAIFVVALLAAPHWHSSTAAQSIPVQGDEIIVRVDDAPARAGQETIARLSRETSLVVHDVKGAWLLVTLPRGRQQAWLHQNYVALKDSPARIGEDPVPIANLLRMPMLDPRNPFLLMHFSEAASGIIASGRQQELLRIEDGLFNTLKRVTDSRVVNMTRVSIYGVMGEIHLNLGNRMKGLDRLNRGYAALEAVEREARPPEGVRGLIEGDSRLGLQEHKGLLGFVEGTKGGDLAAGERKLADATARLDEILPANVLKNRRGMMPIDGKTYTEHADLLIRLGRVPEALPQLDKGEKYNAAFRSYAADMGNNVSGTTGWLESLRSLCLLKAGDRAAALEEMESAQRQLHLNSIWSGHVENPNWEYVVREVEPGSGLTGSPFDYAMSLAFHLRNQPRTAELSAPWVLNRKLKLEERLRQRMALIRRTPGEGPARIPGQPMSLIGVGLGKHATMPRILAARGLAADYRLRKFSDADRADAEREFQMIRSVGASLASTRGAIVSGVPQGLRMTADGKVVAGNAVKWHDELAARTWVEVPAIQASLKEGRALIELIRYRHLDIDAIGDEYRWLPSRYAAWIIPATGDVAQVDLGEADEIDRAIQDLRTKIKADGRPEGNIRSLGEREATDELARTAQKLSDLLIEPLRTHLNRHDKLVISPDGELWLVPWAALPWDDDQFLIERFGLRYVMMGRTLSGLQPYVETEEPEKDKAASRQPGPSVIIADPDFDLPFDELVAVERDVLGSQVAPPPIIVARRGSSLLPQAVRLPFTRPEATGIAPLVEAYTGAKPQVYMGREAIEGLFTRMTGPRILVLGTHGFFLPADAKQLDVATLDINDPTMRCGLLFSGSNRVDDQVVRRGADGILTGYEVEALDLQDTELVVLSACETGIGDAKYGEGVAGLRQAFQIAGAKSVVASLWQVPDRDTALIMIKFFENLAAAQDKSDALRNAQLSRIKERRERYGAAHPLFWAALTLTD